MAEARHDRGDERFSSLLAASTIDAGQVFQLPTGEAGVLDSGAAVSSGARTDLLRTRGKFQIEKATGVVLLPGQCAYWDHSANKATYKKVNDRDFFLGVVVVDAASSDLTAIIDLNKRPQYDIDLLRDGYLYVPVGTLAIDTAGLWDRGGSKRIILSSTSEAQKFDMLSVDGWTPAANAIVECIFRVPSDGAGSNTDVSLGVANGTNATNADSITESLFIHLDGNSTTIYAESDDNSVEVNATDTTATYTEGSAVANRVHVLFDTRDLTDIQIYINGANVLPSTVFRLDAATGPLFLLAHVEKSSSADTYELAVDALRCWFAEQ